MTMRGSDKVLRHQRLWEKLPKLGKVFLQNITPAEEKVFVHINTQVRVKKSECV